MLLDKQQSIILEAKLRSDVLRKELQEIKTKVSQIQQSIAAQHAEAANIAAAEAQAKAQQAANTLQSATPFHFGMTPGGFESFSSFGQENLAKHMVFLIFWIRKQTFVDSFTKINTNSVIYG